MKALTFATEALARPHSSKNKILDCYTTLQHYCQVNYAVDVARITPFINPRFKPITIVFNGSEKAIISAVVFNEKDFTLARYRNTSLLPKYTFNQTNYRCYVLDEVTKRRTVWFFGTSLDHWSIIVPRYLWRFPWYKASIRFEVDAKISDSYQKYKSSKEHPIPFLGSKLHYNKFRMTAESDWAPAEITVVDSGRETRDEDFPGFPDKETALIYLTHPMSGHFYLRDSKKMGCWEIWHRKMNPTLGIINNDNKTGLSAVTSRTYFGLLERMGLIDKGQTPYNILLQDEIDYDIFLPPISSISEGSRYA